LQEANLNRRLILALLLFMCAGCSHLPFQEKHEWDGPFFFIQMADPQFGFFEKDGSFEKETILFEKAIAHVNRLRPAFVVVCGDLVNIPGDQSQAQELLRIAGQLDPEIPLYWVAGNHEIKNSPDAEKLEWYRHTFGEDRYSFFHGGCKFLVLNTTLIKSPDSLPDETRKQWMWLNESLPAQEGETPMHTIMFQHHPWFLQQADENDQYYNIPVPSRTKYLDLLRENDVAAVFCGHYHKNSYAKDGEMLMITSGPVGRPLGKDPSGIRIVSVFRDRIEHEYYGLDNVPESVNLRKGTITLRTDEGSD